MMPYMKLYNSHEVTYMYVRPHQNYMRKDRDQRAVADPGFQEEGIYIAHFVREQIFEATPTFSLTTPIFYR